MAHHKLNAELELLPNVDGRRPGWYLPNVWEGLVWKWSGRMAYRLLGVFGTQAIRKLEPAPFWRSCHQKESGKKVAV